MTDPAPFECRTQHKVRLAESYFPDISPKAAKQRLYRLMKHCRPLQDELAAMGYDPQRQYFMKQEVRVIVKHLGEP